MTILKPILEFWLIRRIDTHEFLPQVRGASTWLEFTHRGVPRLFRCHRGAAVCLSWWLRGRRAAVRKPGERVRYKTEAMSNRIKEEFEVVRVRIEEYKP